MSDTPRIRLHYFTDVLCVWAYTAQIRLDELMKNFGSQIDISYHFLPIFGCTERRIGDGWKTKGSFGGFCQHTREVCQRFPHVEINPNVWAVNTPKTSASAHMFLKSVQLLEKKRIIDDERHAEFNHKTRFEEAAWRTRLAFFRDARDVGRQDEQMAIAADLQLPLERVLEQMHNGEAMAAQFCDIELRDEFKVEGSPTYILNEGRQKLYGNVGYRIIEANVLEIMKQPFDQASWC
ncbi:MAG: disulfide bond formation protein DsbA [Gammaproteobacteria bacterium]|nr:disulfide bond formation protein DsbA [Gammaproteobacteria bacterium]